MPDLVLEAGVPAPVIVSLKRRYGEAQRRYHTWHHIEHMLDVFEETKNAFANPQAAALAILFHDAIYDPKAKDNEARSAELLRREVQGAIDSDVLCLAEVFINATAKHQILDDLSDAQRSDCALFLDIDMSILGADWPVYKTYAAQIREEYDHVSNFLYRMGRRKVLKEFLKRPAIFLSDLLAHRYEAQAQENIERELTEILT